MSTNSGSNSNGTSVPKPRAEWIVRRKQEAVRTGDTNMSQALLIGGGAGLYLLGKRRADAQ